MRNGTVYGRKSGRSVGHRIQYYSVLFSIGLGICPYSDQPEHRYLSCAAFTTLLHKVYEIIYVLVSGKTQIFETIL